MEHIYTQVHLEDYFINLAAKTRVLVLHARFIWKGNAGPTARLEAGKLLALMKEGLVNSAVINCPKESQSIQYITAHILDAESLCKQGKFRLTRVSPLNLDNNNQPINKEGEIVESGIYSNGSIDEGNLDIFFKAIVKM